MSRRVGLADQRAQTEPEPSYCSHFAPDLTICCPSPPLLGVQGSAGVTKVESSHREERAVSHLQEEETVWEQKEQDLSLVPQPGARVATVTVAGQTPGKEQESGIGNKNRRLSKNRYRKKTSNRRKSRNRKMSSDIFVK